MTGGWDTDDIVRKNFGKKHSTHQRKKDWTPVFNVFRRYLYVCMPVSGIIMVGYSIRNILREMSTFWKLKGGDKEEQLQDT